MVFLALSRSDFSTNYEIEGNIASVVMEAVGPDRVLVEGYMVRYKDWLGL